MTEIELSVLSVMAIDCLCTSDQKATQGFILPTMTVRMTTQEIRHTVALGLEDLSLSEVTTYDA